MENWEDIAREQADTLLKQQAVIAELEEKLRSVKAHLDAVDKDEYLRWNINHFSFNDLMQNLYNILEVNE